MRVPRDVDAGELIALLQHYGYIVKKQTGSHIKMSKNLDNEVHTITIPNHKPIKVGTLQNIVKDVCRVNELDIEEFYSIL